MNNKRQQLLDTALDLFYSKGVQAVGINEVLKASGIAKKTLYHHFSSKQALVLASLNARHETFCAWFEGLIAGAKTNEQLVEAMFLGLSQWFNNKVQELDNFRGCFFINTSAEYCDEEGEISVFCKQHKQNIRNIIAKHMPTPDESLLECLCSLKEGAIVLAYVSQDAEAAQKALSTAKQFMLAASTKR